MIPYCVIEIILIATTLAAVAVLPDEAQDSSKSSSEVEPSMLDRSKRQTWTIISEDACTVPPIPANGKYGNFLLISSDGARLQSVYPGQRGTSLTLVVECDRGFALRGKNGINCVKGSWESELPECKRYCKLPKDDSIQFNCVNETDSTRPCNDIEFPGTVVQPKCLVPLYNATVSTMRCQPDGKWDVVEKCNTGFCKMPSNAPDVEYVCVNYVNSTEVKIPCTRRVLPGTTVKSLCGKRNHYSADMHCLHGGEWNYVAECSPVYCDLPQDDSVDYMCVTYENGVRVVRPCRYRVLPGVTVQPKCRGKNHRDLPPMFCQGVQMWNYVPTCSAVSCELPSHPSVDYTCVINNGSTEITRPCEDKEFPGTTVVPKCRKPNYYGFVHNMHCGPSGTWDNIAICSSECGRVTPNGQPNVVNGTRAKHGELPWHAGIYRKTSIPYSQICGGSLVSTKAVISAAHCFWDDIEGARDPELFAVALGKIYRPWSESQDKDSKHFNVSTIHIPQTFRGSSSNFQNDIAIVILEAEVTYHTYIRPVCLDFDFNFNSKQLQAGKKGEIAGWGLTGPNKKNSPVLQRVELPYIPFGQCYDESPRDFQEYITSDKFCAGYLNGTALCEGDSGGGLVFPENDKGVQRYYLRGIVSTAPRSNGLCDPNVRTTFTEIIYHEHFIKEFINLS